MAAAFPPPYVCPACKGPLERRPDAYRCVPCARTYPVVLGIPDFRLAPDPFISLQDDHKKGRFVAWNMEGLTFEETVRFYWSITPDVTDGRDARFTERVVGLAQRWRDDLPIHLPELRPDEAVLEIGCGTGGFLVAAREHGARVVGIDVAFRWLVVASKQLQEAGLDVPLVCANAEHLPFPDAAFDLVVGESTIEHTRDQPRVLAEARRALREGGRLYLITPNRLSLTPEPHVRVWGVGWLPRAWMSAYVRRVRGIPYRFIRLMTARELRRRLRSAGFAEVRFEQPPLSPAATRHLSERERRLAALYNRIRTWPGLRLLLRLFGPLLHVRARP